MRIKLFAAGAAIALAATIGSASAAEQFSTIEGIAAQRMTQLELAKVVGSSHPNDVPNSGMDSPLNGLDPGQVDLTVYTQNSPNCSLHLAGG